MFVETKRDGELIGPSHSGFIAWLQRQPPEAAYNFMDCSGNCLIGQYLGSLGIGWVSGHTLHTPFYRSLQYVAVRTPHTFGAALKRAEKALKTAL